jgi:hypothetical protein
VDKIFDFNLFIENDGNQIFEREVGAFYHDELNPIFWKKKKDKNGQSEWVFNQRVRRKLLRIANDFYEKFPELLRGRVIKDIQLTGSLSNYNYTDFSDLDVHVLVNLDGIDDENPKILKAAIDGIRFIWNLRHNISIRGYDTELYLQSEDEPHDSSGLFSLLNNEWIKTPVFSPPSIDEMDMKKKYDSISEEIDKLHTKLRNLSDLPSNAKALYKRCLKLKDKIQKMRKESLSRAGEMSIGNLVFKKLRNEGYIEKLIDTISRSYDKIYAEK